MAVVDVGWMDRREGSTLLSQRKSVERKGFIVLWLEIKHEQPRVTLWTSICKTRDFWK